MYLEVNKIPWRRPTRQPEFLKVTKEKIISTAANIADYFNLHFTAVTDKAKRSLLTTNGCNLDKLRQFVSERLPVESQFTIPLVTADMVKAYLLKFQPTKQLKLTESVVLFTSAVNSKANQPIAFIGDFSLSLEKSQSDCHPWMM